MSRTATATGAIDATDATTATNVTDTTRAIGFAASAIRSQDKGQGVRKDAGSPMADATAPASALHGFLAEHRVSLARALCRLRGEYGRAMVLALTLALARHASLPTATVALAQEVFEMLSFDALPADHDPSVFIAPGQPEPLFLEDLHRLRNDMHGAIAFCRAPHGTESN